MAKRPLLHQGCIKMIKMPHLMIWRWACSPADFACVRWGHSTLPKTGRSPQFSAHVYCSQTAAWIKICRSVRTYMPRLRRLCWMETQSPPPKRGRSPPIFGPSLLWPNGWMHQDATGNGGRPRPTVRDIVYDVDPATPRKMAHPPHPIFAPCLLWLNGWLDEDAD